MFKNEHVDLIEAVSGGIGDCTVGFVRLEDRYDGPDAVPAGSGSLVTIGSLHGILTAAHVLRYLPEHGEVGLVQFSQRQTAARKLTILMEHTERLLISASQDGPKGPDLGFLKLAAGDVGTLKARNIFFNLSQRRSLILSDDLGKRPYFDGISGMIAEWTGDCPMEQPQVRVRGFKALYGAGLVVKTNDADGFDVYDFEVTYGPDTASPVSFRGMSGGGLWRVYCSKADNGVLTVLEKKLIGVAFYQSDLEQQRRIISCHGPRSVYGRLMDAVLAKWPQ